MIAIYARQSVERPDSISIAMQVEHCRRICPRSVPQQVYTDRGFSGTNTRRPALQQMLEAVEQGQIESVYVYKLDRISRSLCDFAAMMQEFRRRGVTLHSVRESFDTQTEIGGMLRENRCQFRTGFSQQLRLCECGGKGTERTGHHKADSLTCQVVHGQRSSPREYCKWCLR